MESCPPSGSRSAGNNGHGLRGDNARRSRAAWVAGHVHHRLGHPGPRPPAPPGPAPPVPPGQAPPVPPGLWENAWPALARRQGATPNLGKSVPTPLRGSALSPRGFGVPLPAPSSPACPCRPSRLFPQTPAGAAGRGSTGRYRAAPRCARLRSPRPAGLSHPSSTPPAPRSPPEPPSPHYSCYPKAASVPKRRHVRGKQRAIVRSLGTRGGGAGAAARRPPPGPRSDAIVMEIGLSPHAVELDVDSFSLEFHISSVTCFVGKFSPELRCEIN